jgi:hypothetical protein
METSEVEVKPKRGRPKTQHLSKKEYNLQRYYENKDHMNKNNTKNMTKYRDSFKVLKQLSEDECFKFLTIDFQNQITALVKITNNPCNKEA